MIADVGIVGLPNAGKSTLLAAASNARPEIANYAFTTLTPNLGVVDLDDNNSLLLADVPGLIEGASQGRGLGDEFLRHVERTAVLIHMIDAYQDDPVGAYQTIQKELQEYQVDLTTRPQVLVLNKIDGLDDDQITDIQKQLAKVAPKGTQQFAISAKSGQGVKTMLYAVKKLVDERAAAVIADEEAAETLPILRLPENMQPWKVEKVGNDLVVTGRKIERFAERTDFASAQTVERLRDIMRKMGIMHELRRQGAEPDQTIVIGRPPIGSIKY